MRNMMVLLVLFWGAVSVGCPSEPPPPVTACSSCGAIELVWLKSRTKGPVNEAFIKQTAQTLERRFGLSVSVHTPIAIDPKSFNMSRRQYNCDKLNEHLKGVFKHNDESNVTRLALTNADIFAGKWQFVYGCQFSHRINRTGVGVVSSHKMGKGPEGEARVLTMLGKYIALISCKTPPSMHPKHITYSGIRSARAIDKMGTNVCWRAPK